MDLDIFRSYKLYCLSIQNESYIQVDSWEENLGNLEDTNKKVNHIDRDIVKMVHKVKVYKDL